MINITPIILEGKQGGNGKLFGSRFGVLQDDENQDTRHDVFRTPLKENMNIETVRFAAMGTPQVGQQKGSKGKKGVQVARDKPLMLNDENIEAFGALVSTSNPPCTPIPSKCSPCPSSQPTVSPSNPTMYPFAHWVVVGSAAANKQNMGGTVAISGQELVLDLGIHNTQVAYAPEILDDGRTLGEPPDEDASVLMNVDVDDAAGSGNSPMEDSNTWLRWVSSAFEAHMKGALDPPRAQDVAQTSMKGNV